jgi:hypothetical protein
MVDFKSEITATLSCKQEYMHKFIAFNQKVGANLCKLNPKPLSNQENLQVLHQHSDFAPTKKIMR